MAFSTAFLSLMPSTIRVSTRGSHSNYGEPSFAASTTKHRCRIVEKPGFVRNAEGEEIAYRHVIWARSTGATSITATDKVTLPDGTSPPVVAVERYTDEDNEHHVKLHMGH